MEPANKQDCEICYKIICGNCKWEAGEKETEEIQKGNLKNCPTCGWSPNN
jgi:hypothetical protein